MRVLSGPWILGRPSPAPPLASRLGDPGSHKSKWPGSFPGACPYDPMVPGHGKLSVAGMIGKPMRGALLVSKRFRYLHHYYRYSSVIHDKKDPPLWACPRSDETRRPRSSARHNLQWLWPQTTDAWTSTVKKLPSSVSLSFIFHSFIYFSFSTAIHPKQKPF